MTSVWVLQPKLKIELKDRDNSSLIGEAEALAKSQGFAMINLDVRATQERAIQSFEARGFSKYATNPFYARVEGDYVPGLYYHKEL